MYSTCLFCTADLGRNEELEAFPVGRRLAFDGAKGRLWVVCRRCERWNLTPAEERWEALEECERFYRGTRLRVSTDNIGLARLTSGLELVRIGSALRPELAAWRYGDQFGRRRRKHLMYTGVGVALAGGFLVAGPVTGWIAGGSWGLFNLLNTFHSMYEERRVRARFALPGSSTPIAMRRKHLARTRLIAGPSPSEWLLRISFLHPKHRAADDKFVGTRGRLRDDDAHEVELSGAAAIQAAGRILPQINDKGAKGDSVQRAVQMLESHTDPDALFTTAARRDRGRHFAGETGVALDVLPIEMRLALEMIAHEEAERRALEGELALLEAAWRQAEEIASIADDLLTPPEIDRWIEEQRPDSPRREA